MEVDVRRVARAVVALCVVALAVTVAVLYVAGVHRNSQITRLQHDGVAVRLTVTGSEWRYLMIEDPIPSGAEFIERDNVYQLRNRPPWWEYWFTRRELHDDRLAIFQTYFAEGQKDYFYLLKVVNPGLFQVSPARVGPMYQPGIMSTSESRRLEVK